MGHLEVQSSNIDIHADAKSYSVLDMRVWIAKCKAKLASGCVIVFVCSKKSTKARTWHGGFEICFGILTAGSAESGECR